MTSSVVLHTFLLGFVQYISIPFEFFCFIQLPLSIESTLRGFMVKRTTRVHASWLPLIVMGQTYISLGRFFGIFLSSIKIVFAAKLAVNVTINSILLIMTPFVTVSIIHVY